MAEELGAIQWEGSVGKKKACRRRAEDTRDSTQFVSMLWVEAEGVFDQFIGFLDGRM